MNDFLRRWKVWLPLLLAVLTAFGVVVTVSDDNGDGTPDHVTVIVNRAAGDGAATKTLTVPQAAVEQARAALEDDLRTTPEQTPAAQRAARDAQLERNRETTDPLPTAGATQGIPGCVSKFVVNQSGRGGVRPVVQVLHYTVSGNRPGWSDVNAIVALFNTPSFQASSNFVLDSEGHCAYIVPLESKSWTQAGGNPISVSYEIINTGSESVYLGPAGLQKLRQVMRVVAQRTGIPLRRGTISGCSATTSGIVQHADGGICWGGHGDIAPFPVAPIVTFVSRAPSPLTAHELQLVANVTATNVLKRTGHSKAFWCRRLHGQRVAIVKAARPPAPPRPGWSRFDRGPRFHLLARPYVEHCR